MPVARTRCADIMRGACVAPATTETSNLKPSLCASTLKGLTMPRACASTATIDNAKAIEHVQHATSEIRIFFYLGSQSSLKI